MINMELIKKINNNFAVARDSSGNTVIVSGRGIGFIKMPAVINDLSIIDRTYYNADERYINLIKQIPEDIMKLSNRIVDYAAHQLKQKLNPNLCFTLADHINFAIERYKQNIQFHFGVTYEMKYLHPEEMKIGEKAVQAINKKFQTNLPDDEVSVIAMHILEAEHFITHQKNIMDIDQIIEDISLILIQNLNLKIDKNSFSYCRFITHIQYLLQRHSENKAINSDNQRLYQSMIEQFPETYSCVSAIKAYFKETSAWSISDEEMLYLMLHINRLCNNEDCNR